jgi:hypothetical protein
LRLFGRVAAVFECYAPGDSLLILDYFLSFCGRTRSDQMSDKTAIQRIKELDQERATLFEQAKEEALRRANDAVEDLNALGLHYRLVTGTAAGENKSAGKESQKAGVAIAGKKS